MDTPEIPDANDHSRSFLNAVALAVTFISAFMAVSKIKDDNIVQGMQKAQSETVDYWNEYQARRQRQFGVELAIAQLKATQPDGPERQKTLADWQKTADTFKVRAEEASNKAKQRQIDYDAANNRDDMFDLSDALMSVALALFAISALVRRHWLFGVATVFASIGVTFGAGGFATWLPLHDAVRGLIELLS